LQQSFGKGHFLVFTGCKLEGFVAIEERPMTTKNVGPEGGRLSTSFDADMEATFPPGSVSDSTLVKMMVSNIIFGHFNISC
jgi:hypothetical protein